MPENFARCYAYTCKHKAFKEILNSSRAWQKQMKTRAKDVLDCAADT